MSQSRKGVPRGPAEWGDLLYEPQWAKERRFEDTTDVMMGLFVVVCAIALILVVIDGIIRQRPPIEDTLLLLGIIVFTAFTPLIFLWPELRKMPFRVYEAGVTNHEVTMLQGFSRRDQLISSAKVMRIDFDAISSTGPSQMEIVYVGPKGESILLLTRGVVDDPLEVMLALHKILPDRLDEKAYEYMDPDGDDPVVQVPGSGTSRRRGVNWMFFTFLGSYFLFAVMLGGSFLPLVISEPTVLRSLVCIIIICVASIITTTMMIYQVRKEFYFKIGWRIHLERDRLVYPIDPVVSAVLRVRPFLPIDEVVEVRKGLDESLYNHVSRLRTANDERIVGTIDIYTVLRDDEGWERSGVVLRNKTPRESPRGRIADIDGWKGFALFSLLTLIALLAGCIAFLLRGIQLPFTLSLEQVFGYFMMVAMAVMGALMLILIVMKTREARLVKTLFVSDKGISTPGARKDLRWIDANGIRACSIQETRWQHEIHIETDRGTLRLPMSAYDKLTEGGVSVEDPNGGIPGKKEEATPPRSPETPP